MNEACVAAGKPLVYGGVSGFKGQASVFDARKGPCLQCLFFEPPAPLEAGTKPPAIGVFGVLPGVIGTLQATEALKLILGRGLSLIGRLLVYDALAMDFSERPIRKRPACPVCGFKAKRGSL
jgi:adenylyltransferase/sulfurtransferase